MADSSMTQGLWIKAAYFEMFGLGKSKVTPIFMQGLLNKNFIWQEFKLDNQNITCPKILILQTNKAYVVVPFASLL